MQTFKLIALLIALTASVLALPASDPKCTFTVLRNDHDMKVTDPQQTALMDPSTFHVKRLDDDATYGSTTVTRYLSMNAWMMALEMTLMTVAESRLKSVWMRTREIRLMVTRSESIALRSAHSTGLT